ncbi:alpha/beta fold hydrolase [Gordonia soli]|uniref:Putative hydrolase n=1 Tax=Gordonia soli NBRC 108243 TaxID=1223545 RepID=M0QHY8_9ACTN|nr:alpha/beta hydrolase [Gordonia soli]GAC67037.1 putative hydrolase [Gordonia soli NBRC 108243]
MTPAFRFADIRGTRLAWNSTGRGRPAVWAHGMSANAYLQESGGQFDWRPVSSGGHRLIRYDARGHGRSDGGRTPAEYTWPELALDLLALLDDVGVDDPVDAIGSSMGTATILTAALDRPRRFRRLVLTTPPTIWETRRAQVPIRESTAVFVERRGVRALERLSVDAPASPALADARRFVNPIAVSSARYPAVLRGSAVSDLPAAERLSAVGHPTLILAWTGDETHPVSSAEALAAALPNADVRVAATPTELATWSGLTRDFLA